jgi:tetratricopeptide (TPR) repeat protein
VLTYRLAERIFDGRAGVVAGLITALYGPLVFFEAELLATGWAAFWSVALVLLLLRACATTGCVPCLLLGLCGALSVLTRPTFLPFFLAAGLWLGIALRRASAGWRLPLRNLLILVAGFALVAVPVAIQSYRVTGHFSILPTSGGINLYIGNSPDPCETVTIRPGSEWLRLTRSPGQHGVVGARPKQSFYYERAWEQLSAQPVGFLRALGRKVLQFASSREIPRNVDIYMFTEWSRFLGMLTWKVGPLGFPFSVLLLLTVLGGIFCWRQVPLPVSLFLLLYPLSVILVLVAARYRLPVVPVMSVLAAGGCLATIEMISARRWRRVAVAGACSVGVVLLATLPGPFCEEGLDLEAEMYRGLGWNHYRAGRLDTAIACTRHALQLDPESATAHNNLGMFLRDRKRIDQAAAHFCEALRIEPDHPNAHANLGGIRLMQGRFEKARLHFSQALRFDPDNPNTHVLLASVLAQQHRCDEAVLHYQQALRLEPDLPHARKGLAAITARLDMIQPVIEECRETLRSDPLDVEARFKLALGLDQQGELEAAVVEYRAVLRDDPQHPDARELLDATAARLDARRAAREIVDTLWAQLNDGRLVARQLRQDDTLAEPVRRAALDLVLRRTMDR